MKAEKDVYMKMRDGGRLVVDIYRPDAALFDSAVKR